MKNNKYAILTTVEASMKAFMLPVAYELKKEGFDVSLISDFSQDFIDEYGKDFRCIHVKMKRGFHFLNTCSVFFKLKKIFKREKSAVIDYATENVSLPASYAGACCKIPVRIYNHWGARFVGFNGIKRVLSKTIERLIGKKSTDIRQVSEKNKQLCIDQGVYKSKECVVLGKGGTIGVDLKRFDVNNKEKYREEFRKKYGIPENSTVFGFVGRIQKDKGVNELLQAYRNISDKYKDSYLVLIGPIDSENPISAENLSFAQGDPHIVLTGRLDNVNEAMCMIDVLIHPTYREGFGMVLQEAGALKIPIITTDIIGPSEFITNEYNGLLIKPKNSEEIELAVEKILENNNGITYAENCYRYVSEYFERSIMLKRIVCDRKSLYGRISDDKVNAVNDK